MVAATPGKPQILKRKIAGFGFGLQACATGWQRPGKPLFLPGTGWNTTEGKGPFHAHATPQNRAQKKEFPLRNADHKKDSAPRSEKKPAFLVGLYSWRSWTLRGDHPTPARKLPQKSAQKKEFSEAIKRRASIAGGHPAGHYVAIVRGESVRNWTHKKGGERFHAPRFPQFHDRFSRRLFFTQSDR